MRNQELPIRPADFQLAHYSSTVQVEQHPYGGSIVVLIFCLDRNPAPTRGRSWIIHMQLDAATVIVVLQKTRGRRFQLSAELFAPFEWMMIE